LGGLLFEVRLGKYFVRSPFPKQPKQKWAGGVAQAVEYLQAQNPEFKSQAHQKENLGPPYLKTLK
jgi:hypothetical protein